LYIHAHKYYDELLPGGGYAEKSDLERNRSHYSKSGVVLSYWHMLALFRISNNDCHAMRGVVVKEALKDSPVSAEGGTYKKYWE
jgi:hypothetical protein